MTDNNCRTCKGKGWYRIHDQSNVMEVVCKDCDTSAVNRRLRKATCDDGINYRKGSEDCRRAWFRYRILHQSEATSVAGFVAGWNAALESTKDKP